jgi:hypothetical protein
MASVAIAKGRLAATRTAMAVNPVLCIEISCDLAALQAAKAFDVPAFHGHVIPCIDMARYLWCNRTNLAPFAAQS